MECFLFMLHAYEIAFAIDSMVNHQLVLIPGLAN